MELKKMREDAGFSQRELADKLGIGANTVNQWEKGKREPSITHIKELATVLSCSADELLGINKTTEEVS